MGTKTDNSYLRDKVELRIGNLPPGPVRVIDCFSGKGLIWAAVKKLSGRDIVTLPIDKRTDINDFHLHGDNLDFLETMDLSRFNVIDLDSYGIPFDQIEVLVHRKFCGVVFVTAVWSTTGRMVGAMPHGLLRAIGFSDEQIQKCPTLFSRRGWEYFLQYLASVGVRSIRHRSHARKHYLAMQLSGAAPGAKGSSTRREDRVASLS